MAMEIMQTTMMITMRITAITTILMREQELREAVVPNQEAAVMAATLVRRRRTSNRVRRPLFHTTMPLVPLMATITHPTATTMRMMRITHP